MSTIEAQQLKWKKSIFKNSYEIFDANKKVAELKLNTWNTKAEYITDDNSYTFVSRGIASQNVDIFEDNETTLIGNMSFNNWQTNAKIKINTEYFEFKYDNKWQSRWSISNRTEQVSFKSEPGKGIINTDSDKLILIGCGLYTQDRNSNSLYFITICVLFFLILI